MFWTYSVAKNSNNWTCPKGHEYAKTGAYKSGQCKVCYRAKSRKSNRV